MKTIKTNKAPKFRVKWMGDSRKRLMKYFNSKENFHSINEFFIKESDICCIDDDLYVIYLYVDKHDDVHCIDFWINRDMYPYELEFEFEEVE